MNNENLQFSTWKDFGRHVLQEQDALRDEQKELKTEMKTSVKDIDERLKYIEKFNAQVKLIGIIALAILGSLEGFIALYLILK